MKKKCTNLLQTILKQLFLILFVFSLFLQNITSIAAVSRMRIQEYSNAYGPYYGIDISKETPINNRIKQEHGEGLSNLRQFTYNEEEYEEETSFVYEEAIDENTTIYVDVNDSNHKQITINPVHDNYYNGSIYQPIDTTIQPIQTKKLFKSSSAGNQYPFVNETNSLTSRYSMDVENIGITMKVEDIEVYYRPIFGNYTYIESVPVESIQEEEVEENSNEEVTIEESDIEVSEPETEIEYETVTVEDKISQVESPWVEGSQIIYPLSNETNLRYTIGRGSIKEDIILNTVGNPNTYQYSIDVVNGEVYAIEDALFIIDENQDIKMIITAPKAYDRAGNETSIQIQYEDGIVTYTVDLEWLNSEERVYPIIIDPNHTVYGNEGHDISTVQRYPTSTVGEINLEATDWKITSLYHARMYVGSDPDYLDSYSFYKVRSDTIAAYLKGKYIKKATLELPIYSKSGAGQLNGCTITTNYNIQTAVYNNTEDAIKNVGNCTFAKYDTSSEYIHLDITDYLKGVVEEGKGNYGVILSLDDQYNTWLRLYASEYYNYELGTGRPFGQKYPGTKVEFYDSPDVSMTEINDFTYQLRPFVKYDYTEGVAYFVALGVDGVAPYQSDVYFTIKDEDEEYTSKTMNAFDNFFHYPDYPDIQDVPKKWTTKESNYQTDEFFEGFKVDKIYDIEIYAKKGSNQSEVKKTWFQLYESNNFDLLTNIATFYDVPVSVLKEDNNLEDNLITEGNLLFIREPKKNKGIHYEPEDLSQDEKEQIDALLRGRGLQCEFGNEPINFNTGNFLVEEDDLALQVEGETFHFSRIYNSVSSHLMSEIGYGWTHSLMSYVSISKDGAIVLLPNSKKYYFTKQQDGTYVCSLTNQFVLTNNGSHFILYDNDQDTTYSFLETGLLGSITNHNNRVTELQYNEDLKLTKVVLSNGMELAFIYKDSFISKIELNDGTSVSYQYDENDNLIQYTDQSGFVTSYQYDDKHRIVSWTNRNGEEVITNEYDDQNRVIKQTDHLGNVYQTTYQDVQTINTDPNGNRTIYTYDQYGGLTGITYADGQGIQKRFENTLLTYEKTETGLEYNYLYNQNRDLIKKMRSDGYEEEWSYDDNHNVLSYSNSEGQTMAFTYDGNGNETSRTNALGDTSYKTYDGHSNLLTETDYNGNQTSYTYNEKNQLTRVNYPDGSYYTYQYDTDGYLSNTTDMYGNTTYLVHNERNELVLQTNPDGTTIKYEYDGNGNQIAIENENGYVTRYTYDIYGNKLTETDALSNITRYEYDFNQNLIKTTYPDGSTIINTYDTRNRVSSTTNNTHQTKYTYNSYGIDTITNERGQIKSFEYDALGNVIKITDFDGLITINTYDVLSRLTSTTNSKGIQTTYEYDELDRVIKEDNPLVSLTYEYDSNGNTLRVIYKSDDSNRTTEYTYNEMNRQIEEINTVGGTTTYTYEGPRLIESIDPNGNTTEWKYDSRDRVIEEILEDGSSRTWTYDGVGNKISETDTNGYTQSFVYDGNNNPLQIVDKEGNATNYSYDSMKRQISSVSPLGYKETYTYDLDGNIVSKKINEREVSTFVYDVYGNVISENVNGLTTTYEYDEYNQVIKMVEPTGLTTTYTYDTYHRLLKTTVNNEDESIFTYDQYDRVLTETDLYGEIRTNKYNSDLNLIETTYHNLKTTYEYDELDRIIKEEDSLGNIKETVYDSNSNVIEETINGDTSYYTYNSDNRMIEEINTLGYKTVEDWDHEGNLLSIKNANGNTTSYTYNKNNLLLTTSINGTLISSNGYNEDSFLVKETDGEGYSKQYEYDSYHNLVKEVDKRGYPTEYTYDEHFNRTSTTDAKGNTTTYTYNELNQVISEKDALGNITTYEYDIFSNISKKVNPLGGTFTSTYNSKNQLESEVDERGLHTAYTYNSFNDLVSITKDGVINTSYEYDSYGREITLTNSLGNSEKRTYDSRDNILSITYPNGGKETFKYDSENQMVESVDVLGVKTTYEYDGVGNCITTNINNERILKNEYDAYNNLSSSIDAKGNRTEYIYNTRNELVETKDALGNSTKTTYLPTGEIEKEIDQNGNEKKNVYDEVGNLIQTIDAEDNITTNTYNNINQLISVQNPRGYHINYEYNALGSLIKEYDESKETTYQYNQANDLIEIKQPKGKKETYTYDVYGNVLSYTQKNGKTIKYTYDTENNVLSKNNIQFKYNEMGSLIEMKDNSGTTTYSYNKVGSMTSSKQIGKEVHYEYNPYNELVSITYPNGSKTTYEYDENSNISKMSGNGLSVSYEYDKLNRETKQTRSNNVMIDTTYDKVGNIASMKTVSNGNTLFTASYTYNKNNSLLKEDIKQLDKNIKKTYTYNENDELTSSILNEDGKETKTEYVITLDGNVSEVTGGKVNTRNEYNELNQVTKSTHDGYTFTYTYDDNGNRTQEKRSDGRVRQYTWDEFNRLTQVKNFDGVLYEYTYDGQDHRLSLNAYKAGHHYETKEYVVEDKIDKLIKRLKTASSTEYGSLCLVSYYNEDEVDPLPQYTTTYHTGKSYWIKEGYDYGYHKEYLKYRVDDSIETKIEYVNGYIYEYEQVLTEIQDGKTNNYVFGNTRVSSNKYNYVSDRLGNLIMSLNPSGTLNTEYTYSDYGVRDSGYDVFNTSSNPIGYTGEYLEPTGLIYLRARYYDPYTSTFISEDIYHGILYDPSSRNRYSYGRRNSKKYIDPSGHWPQWLNNAINKAANVAKNAYNAAKNVVINAYNTYVKPAVTKAYNNYVKPAGQAIVPSPKPKPAPAPKPTPVPTPTPAPKPVSKPTQVATSYTHSSGGFSNSGANYVASNTFVGKSSTGNAASSKPVKTVGYVYKVSGKTVTQTATQAIEAAVKANTTIKSIIKDVIKPSIQKTVTPASRINTTRLNLQTKVNKLVDTFKVVSGSLFDRVKGICEDAIRIRKSTNNQETKTSGGGGGSSYAHYLIKPAVSGRDLLSSMRETDDNDDDFEKIYEELSYRVKRDFGLVDQYKNIGYYDTKKALNKVFELDDVISNASVKYGVDKTMIQTVLFRELRMINIGDDLADSLVLKYYNYKEEFNRYSEGDLLNQLVLGPPSPPIIQKDDSSTGVGQIFARTAIDAQNTLINKEIIQGDELDFNNENNVYEMWKKLHDDEQFNVEMIAIVLRYEAIDNKITHDFNNYTDEDIKTIFSSYNGDGPAAELYGEQLSDWRKVFEEYR